MTVVKVKKCTFNNCIIKILYFLEKEKVYRAGSGDTDGPDNEDEANPEVDDAQVDPTDAKHSFNSAEISQKAVESAKYFGSKYFIFALYRSDITMILFADFLFSVANKAGQTVSATAKQIKSTVENVVSDGTWLMSIVQNKMALIYFRVLCKTLPRSNKNLSKNMAEKRICPSHHGSVVKMKKRLKAKFWVCRKTSATLSAALQAVSNLHLTWPHPFQLH